MIDIIPGGWQMSDAELSKQGQVFLFFFKLTFSKKQDLTPIACPHSAWSFYSDPKQTL